MTLQSPIPNSSSAPGFDVLPEALRGLARRGVTRSYRKHTLIIEEGTQGDTLYLLLSGRVKAFSIDHREHEVTYGVYGAGEYFGEMSLDGGPRSASVMALEPSVCVVLTRQSLREHIAAEPEFAFELLSRVIRRARMATANARSMALLDVYGRVVQLLVSLATPQLDGTRLIAERLTHGDIASRVGCSREMVSRLLKDLEQGDYIAISREGVRLLQSLPQRW
ncbi:Crp/Fnr family transcriptional regulator [Roseateles toxinivorans]|uniref:CRP/FNR family cyclic AMP-dependent transcriptional regulator n=1 Tax=Roseateles toxinivorans TaxID=270368 RepID=A0A4V3CS32_9BURK|nr:Crp/Fnr family transcriptional regulator [Roseateles toxinivorans]TDP59062.1 CRP/FNR family cyclic AMP-dependent transcriptional regulator [Roseateles toxinivorans]